MFSVGDKNRLMCFSFELPAFIDRGHGAILELEPAEDGVEYVELPSYDGLHVTRRFSANLSDDIEILEKFGTHTISISFDGPLDLSDFKVINNVVDDTPKVFQIVDSSGNIYQANAFIGVDEVVVYDHIPDYASGIVVNRLPDNLPNASAAGYEVINAILPDGNIRIVFKSIAIFCNSLEATLSEYGSAFFLESGLTPYD